MSAYELGACNQILNSFILWIEGNIDAPAAQSIESHLSACPNCNAEFAHERTMHTLLQDVLRRTCNETAPVDLHDSIYQQIHAQLTGAFTTEVISEFSMTEISIEIDEFGNIEHREVTIEHTEEIRFLDDSSDSDKS